MIKNYLKVGLRNLLKNRAFSFINIFGLALSMSVTLLLIMLIADQKNNDSYNTNKHKIYRITHNRPNSDDFIAHYATTTLPLAERLKNEYNDVDYAVRIRRDFGNDWIAIEQNVNVPIGGFYVDPEFLNLFQYTLLAGDPATALVEPNTVVLKEKAAIKIFGTTEAMGKIITVGELGDFMVTGIIKDNNEQSHIRFEALASFATLKRLEDQDSLLRPSVNNWQNRTSGYIYIQLKDEVDVATVEQHLEAINKDVYREPDDLKHEYLLQSLSNISPGPLLSNPIGPGLPNIFLYFLSALALVIMLSASFNYMNLSIARALTRAREVGIRKVSGAMKSQLVFQFLTEAVLLSLSALAFSYGIIYLIKPAFTRLHFAELLQWNLRLDSSVIFYSVVFSLIIGAVSGIIPALTLASFQPSKVLKNLSGIKLFSKLGLRKFLIVAQFSLSLIFIISATLIFNQLKMMISADYGFRTADIINVRLNNTSYKQFRFELEKHPEVLNVAAASHIPAAGTTRDTHLKKQWPDEVGNNMALFYVDENYISALNLQLIAGTNFQTLDASANEIIINQNAVEVYGFGSAEAAIGQYLIDVYDSTDLKIVGVVKDYNHQMLMSEMSPVMLMYNPEKVQIAHVTLLPGVGKRGNDIIEEAFTTVNPGLKVDAESFSDQLIFYNDLLFGDIVKIISLATFLTLIIACLGLLGIATYTVETKTKEVGIRKVLGATSGQLILQLSRGFASIILIAIIVALPIAYYLNNLWLQGFAFRTPISAGVLLFGVLILLVLAILTIGSQTLRAGRVNPVESLRSE